MDHFASSRSIFRHQLIESSHLTKRHSCNAMIFLPSTRWQKSSENREKNRLEVLITVTKSAKCQKSRRNLLNSREKFTKCYESVAVYHFLHCSLKMVEV